jgi:hypothetical protein
LVYPLIELLIGPTSIFKSKINLVRMIPYF